MKRHLLPAALMLGLLTPLAGAQTGPTVVVAGAAAVPADDKLYQALGGRDAIQAFTNDFYASMLADPRLAPFFDGINAKHLQRVLADYFCVVAGGPCVYDGVGMKDAHAHLGVGKGDFNALVEHLQRAMDRAGVPFATQNRLLARLAPSHRDIVTR
ncbi:group 1 truncated hemoglobin [Roseateles sp. DXS20W]|uniref:Group 1 truncated hemoglobin n=1 Tax=Pelomonas lactea TaxID=3299030 RepID=A0ABW7GQU8_9BURK